MKKNKKIKKKSFFFFLLHAFIFLVAFLCFLPLRHIETQTVDAFALSLHAEPKEQARIVAQAPYHTKIEILERLDYWCKVRVGQKEGWVARWTMQPQGKFWKKASPMYTTKQLAMKTMNNQQSPTLYTLPKGTQVHVWQTKYQWSFIQQQNRYGWVPTASLSEIQSTENPIQKTEAQQKDEPKVLYVRQEHTKLREKTNTKANVVAELAAGTKVNVLKDKNKGWYYVQTSEGQKGYIASWLLSPENLNLADKKKNRIKGAVIVIDPGHGGQDSGSISEKNQYEKDATLQTCLCLAKLLKEKGAKVILTRTDDSYVSLGKRVDISNENEADAFICIHYDSTAKHNIASGTTTYYYHKNSRELAEDINQQLKTLPLPNRGVEFGNHQVTRDNNEPAVLLELGYMSTSKDAHYIFSTHYQKMVAQAITQGLENYFSSQNQKS